MYKNMYVIASLLLVAFCIDAKHSRNCLTPTKTICQKDIPFTIKCPGTYCLSEGIRHSRQDVAAITIKNVDGVFLEGGNRVIDLANEGSQAIAIENASNVILDGIVIKNSNLTLIDDLDVLPCAPLTTIPNFRVAAVRLDSVQDVFLTNLKINNVLNGIVGTNVKSNFNIGNCIIADFGVTVEESNLSIPFGAGILLFGTSSTERMSNVTISNSSFTSESGKYGCWLMFANGSVIDNCFGASAHKDVPMVSIGAYTLVDSTGIALKNSVGRFGNHHIFALRCQACDISDFKSFDTNHNGIEITFCEHCTVRNCVTQRTNSNGGDTFTGSGLVLNFDNYCSIQSSVASNYIQGTTSNTGCGIVVNASQNCEVIGCTAYGNNFGIKNIVSPSGQCGSPCGLVPCQNNRFYSNFANDNLIQNYSAVPLVVDSEPATTPINTTLVPYVNVQAPNLPTT